MTTVPGSLTSFVGREAELEQLRARLAEHRLVTLTGEGGSGKIRLAAQVCRELASAVDTVGGSSWDRSAIPGGAAYRRDRKSVV